MNTTLFFCEQAETAANGKLNAVGIFNELYAPAFPAKQDRLILAGIIEWDRHIEGRQSFTIHLLDPDGKPAFTVEGHSDVDPRSENRAPARTHLILPLEDLIFIKPGNYRIQLEIQDQQITGPSLFLLRSKAVDNDDQIRDLKY